MLIILLLKKSGKRLHAKHINLLAIVNLEILKKWFVGYLLVKSNQYGELNI